MTRMHAEVSVMQRLRTDMLLKICRSIKLGNDLRILVKIANGFWKFFVGKMWDGHKKQAIDDFRHCQIVPAGKTFKIVFKLVTNFLQLLKSFPLWHSNRLFLLSSWSALCFSAMCFSTVFINNLGHVLLDGFPFFAFIRLVFANTRQVLRFSNNILNQCEI